jgi:hypothetical protein
VEKPTIGDTEIEISSTLRPPLDSKKILEEKKNELSPHSKIPLVFLQNFFNTKGH